MDVLIRDVDDAFIAEVDERAKKLNVSRQSYLKKVLESLDKREAEEALESRYERLLSACLDVSLLLEDGIERNTEVLRRLCKEALDE